MSEGDPSTKCKIEINCFLKNSNHKFDATISEGPAWTLLRDDFLIRQFYLETTRLTTFNIISQRQLAPNSTRFFFFAVEPGLNMSSLKPTSIKQRGKTLEKKTENVNFRIGQREKEYDNEFVFSSR